VPGGSGHAVRRDDSADPTIEGGETRMAKKAAKGGAKKGGKKR
jgi:hypothetical protein